MLSAWLKWARAVEHSVPLANGSAWWNTFWSVTHRSNEPAPGRLSFPVSIAAPRGFAVHSLTPSARNRHAAILGVVLAGVLAGCATVGSTSSGDGPAPAAAGAAAIDQLVVAPDGPVTGYAREADFGTWLLTAPGCDTRDVVLARDLTDTTVRHGCDVVAGTLHSPYTGATITGATRTVQIDHRVPLALAWRTGAATWTRAQRVAFANDPAELVAVEGPVNEAKGDDGPETWTPTADRCGYARAFVAVAAKYRLTISPARKQALEQLEVTCPT